MFETGIEYNDMRYSFCYPLVDACYLSAIQQVDYNEKLRSTLLFSLTSSAALIVNKKKPCIIGSRTLARRTWNIAFKE